MKIENVTFDKLYERIKRTYEGNNHVSTVKVEFYDGTRPLTMVFKSPEGFCEDQRERKGTIELLVD